MKNCKLSNDLDRWLDLPPSRREALEEHAKSCADCQRELTAIRRVEALFERGRDGYLDLRYGGDRPTWITARPRPAPWSTWILRPAPALAAAVLVLAATLAIDWSGRQEEPAVGPQLVEVQPLPLWPFEDGTPLQDGSLAAAWDVDPPPVFEPREKHEKQGSAESPTGGTILMARDEGTQLAFEPTASRFSTPSGTAFSLTEVRRAVRSELRKPRPGLPPRPSTWRTKFPRRPASIETFSPEDQG